MYVAFRVNNIARQGRNELSKNCVMFSLILRQLQHKFDLFYYDGLANQDEEIRLTIGINCLLVNQSTLPCKVAWAWLTASFVAKIFWQTTHLVPISHILITLLGPIENSDVISCNKPSMGDWYKHTGM